LKSEVTFINNVKSRVKNLSQDASENGTNIKPKIAHGFNRGFAEE
jgi:hypothetical protein